MGKVKVKQRVIAGILGKPLTRRSKGVCELCGSSEQPFPFELSPFPPEPELERSLMACARCRRWLDSETINPIEAHFLSSAIWSDLPPVRLAAARLLLVCDDLDNPWLKDALANIDLNTGEYNYSG